MSCWNSVFTLKNIHFSLSLFGSGFHWIHIQKLHFGEDNGRYHFIGRSLDIKIHVTMIQH